MTSAPHPAFSGCGIELEYMIVDRASLCVRPIADVLLIDAAGQVVNEIERGDFGWSNELAMHVVEIKNRRPSRNLMALADGFQAQIAAVNQRLAARGARLMPSGAHPWMDPAKETELWRFGDAAIYRTYDRIFGCRQHGFANIQSLHVNLPFAGADEFVRLHTAVRLLLPILPALAASSPIMDGAPAAFIDARMAAYQGHQMRLPESMGRIVPEPIADPAHYRSQVLEPMYRAVAALDDAGTLCHEWLNARGAIARFDRDAIEIRVIDVQECPQADLAIAAVVVAVLKAVYERRHGSLAAQLETSTDALVTILNACIRDADQAEVNDTHYLGLLGWHGGACTAGRLWRHLIETADLEPAWEAPLQTIIEHGPLARRILKAAGDCAPVHLHEVYAALCDCLAEGRSFRP